VVLFDKTAKAPIKRGTQITLVHVLTQILKLLHPLMPFITESLWQRINKFNSNEEAESIMLCAYPQVETALIHEFAEEKMHWIKGLIQAIRTLRSEIGINPGKHIPILLRNLTLPQHDLIHQQQHTVSTIAKITLELSDSPTESVVYASTMLGGVEILIPMSGLIDKQTELTRINKELARLDKDIEFARSKLTSQDFTAKAPQELIATMHDKLEQAKLASEKLKQHRHKIELLED